MITVQYRVSGFTIDYSKMEIINSCSWDQFFYK